MVHVILFPMLNVLYFYISTFRSMYIVPNMAVFCSSVISSFPVVLLRLLLLLLLLLLLFRCFLSHVFSSWHVSSSINGDPHLSGFKFQTAVLSILYAMFQV
jgi:hypothetical protein